MSPAWWLEKQSFKQTTLERQPRFFSSSIMINTIEYHTFENEQGDKWVQELMAIVMATCSFACCLSTRFHWSRDQPRASRARGTGRTRGGRLHVCSCEFACNQSCQSEPVNGYQDSLIGALQYRLFVVPIGTFKYMTSCFATSLRTVQTRDARAD